MSVVAPDRTLVQRMEALKLANAIRSVRATFKRNVADGSASVIKLLADPPAEFHSMKVYDLLLALPLFGPLKTRRVLNECRISQAKTVGGLSVRQRGEMSDLLRARGIQ